MDVTAVAVMGEQFTTVESKQVCVFPDVAFAKKMCVWLLCSVFVFLFHHSFSCMGRCMPHKNVVHCIRRIPIN